MNNTIVYDLIGNDASCRDQEQGLIEYWRYSATGNTFLFLDARERNHRAHLSEALVCRYCEQHNVDGMIFLEPSSTHDFHMRYLNADGGEVEMCGNGARSIAHFAKEVLDLKERSPGLYQFTTYSSQYDARIAENYPVRMTELKEEGLFDIRDLYLDCLASYYVNTGVPHCVFLVDSVDAINVAQEGRRIRSDKRFDRGTNVNFYQRTSAGLMMRTFERGVERETLSCGTGAVAVALCERTLGVNSDHMSIKVGGGTLEITFIKDAEGESRWLSGPVEITDRGTLS